MIVEGRDEKVSNNVELSWILREKISNVKDRKKIKAIDEKRVKEKIDIKISIMYHIGCVDRY